MWQLFGEIVDCRTNRIALHHLIMVRQNKKILISIVLPLHVFTCASIIILLPKCLATDAGDNNVAT